MPTITQMQMIKSYDILLALTDDEASALLRHLSDCTSRELAQVFYKLERIMQIKLKLKKKDATA